MKTSDFRLVFLACLFVSTLAQADIYKCPGAGNTVTLSNVEKGKGCKKMVLPVEPRRTPSQPVSPAAKEDNKPAKKISKAQSTYDSAAVERKRVLQEEIDLERSRSDSVKERIRSLNALPTKTPDQVKELVALQQKETLHQSNIQLLQKELNR